MAGIYKVLTTVSTHDFLKEGRTAVSPFLNGREPFERHVVVWAESDYEAVLIAAQMSTCTGGMCTGAILSDWPGSGDVA